MSSTYIHDYAHEYLGLFAKSGLKRQIGDAAVLEKIGAAPVSHVDVHASDTDYGHVMASSSLPAALGTAAVGTSLKYARADHVHPLPTNVDAETAKALKNPFMLYLEGAAVAEDRVDGVTDVHLRILKLDAQALEGLINIDNLPVGTESGTIAAGNHTHDYSGVYAAIDHDHDGVYSPIDHNHNGVYSPIDHTHEDLTLANGGGLKFASGSSYNGGTARTLSIKLDDNFDWSGVHSFPNTIKINKTGVLIGKGSSSAIDSKEGSADKQVLKYTVNNGTGSYGFDTLGIADISGLQEALSGYLPLAGGVMTGPISSRIIENYGRYYGVAWADFDSSNITTIVIETGIAANSSGGTVPSSEDFYQIIVNGISHTKKSETLDVKIGLSITSTGGLTTSASGWSTFGTVSPTEVSYKVVSNKYVLVLTVPSGKYYVWVDVASKYINVRDNYFVDNLPNALGTWSISSSSITGTIDLNQKSLPYASDTHAHAALSAGSGLKYASNGQTYTGTDERTLSVDVRANFDWTGVHSFPNTTKINLTGVLIGKGSSSAIGAVSTSTNRQFLCYNTTSPAGYKFLAITKNDIPNIEALNANAGAAGKLLVSTATGAEWLPAGANGNFLQQTANGLTFSPIRAHTVLQLTSSTTVQFTHTAGTDQTVFLNVAPSTSTTTFNVKVPSPDSTYAGDRIKFVVLNEHDDTYTPIINFVPNDSNDAWQGDHAYDSDPLPTAQRRISCGEMMILYGVSYTANSTTHTFWRAQKLSETSF